MAKYYGEAESTVSAVFDLARIMEPSLMFVDEVDSMLASQGKEEGR